LEIYNCCTGYADLFHQQNGLPLINWPHDVVEDDTEEDAAKVI
jgi:ent-copalyl diphosphate synthase